MSVFHWTAPLFRWAGARWSEEDFRILAYLLRPHVPPGGLFADLGGGTGDLGTGIARSLDARVVVIDPVPQMLRRVRAHPSVSVRLAAAESLPFPDGHFDALVCCDAFHHLRDQDTAASEIARVVRPGGGVLVLDMEATGRWRPVAMLERALGEPAAFKTAAELERLLAAHRILGTSTKARSGSYYFLGSVNPKPSCYR